MVVVATVDVVVLDVVELVDVELVEVVVDDVDDVVVGHAAGAIVVDPGARVVEVDTWRGTMIVAVTWVVTVAVAACAWDVVGVVAITGMSRLEVVEAGSSEGSVSATFGDPGATVVP